jgi:predicted outer membrane protein
MCGALVCGATAAAPAAAAPPLISEQDRMFVTAAGHGGAFEAGAGRHASNNAADEAIRAFGSQMVAEHTVTGASLRNLAVGLGLTVPDAPDAQQRTVLAFLVKLTGPALDCVYAPMEYFDHVATIGAFEREATFGTNPQLRSFASTMLPTLREHRTTIADMVADLDCATATTPPPTLPDPTVPGGSTVPGSTAPGGTVPGGSTVPGGTVPGGNLPGGSTAPGGTVPGGNLPGGSAVPGGTVPGGSTVPGSTVPGGTVPGGSLPGGSTVPGGSLPGGSAVPGGTVPGGSTVPGGTGSGGTVPGSDMPGGSTVPGPVVPVSR